MAVTLHRPAKLVTGVGHGRFAALLHRGLCGGRGTVIKGRLTRESGAFKTRDMSFM